MKFTKSNFSKDELDVLFYALNRYRLCQLDSLKTALEAEKITGFSNPAFVGSIRHELVVIDGLKSNLIRCMLSHSGSDEKPE